MEFIGPLTAEQQRWADEVQAVDAAAAIFEPLLEITRRRERRIQQSWLECAQLFLIADETAWAVAHRAVAETRALSWLTANDAATCLDCLFEGAPCARHQPGQSDHRRTWPHDGRSGPDPDWRRFGSGAAG